MTRRPGRPVARRLVAATLVAGLATGLSTGLAACSLVGADEPETAPARPSPVALELDQAPDGLAVGVVVTLGSAPGQGSEWSEAAEGARVAAYRYQLGGVEVALNPVDDKGTDAGAVAAVEQLADDGVAGIVLATEGSHVQSAVQAADAAGIPVLLPYETDGTELPETAWLTGPDADQVAATLATAMSADDLRRLALVDAGGGALPGLPTDDSFRFQAGDDPARTAAVLSRRARSGRVDAVLVSGPSQLQAQVVQGLQGAQVDLPVLLTPAALSPGFPAALTSSGGTLTTGLTTAGTHAGDVAAMGADADGEALSAYFAALRAVSADTDVTDFFDDEPFVEVSDAADTRSHDAVVALVTAAHRAASAAPGDVAAALLDLRVTHADGLAGPDLDFTAPRVVADEDVVALQASPQGPGLRPVADGSTPRLFWFTAPSD